MSIKFFHLFGVALLSVAIALAGSAAFRAPANATRAPSVLERVLAKGELRCGYTLWPGALEPDANTGKFYGIFYDYMESLGRELDIKINWAEEVSFGDIPAALNAGRIDAMCSGVWTNSARGKFVDFISPIAYQPIQPYVRHDDHRFDEDLNAINQPDIKISIMDGESAETIAKTDFPRAGLLSLPKGTEGAQMFLNVLTHKADVTFIDTETAGRIMAAHPGAMRALAGKFPLRVFGLSLAVKKDDGELRETLNNTTRQLLMTGEIDRMISQHESHTGTYLRAELPFQTTAN